MPKEIIHTSQAPNPIGPYSQAVKAGGLLYTSGQIAIVPLTGHLEVSSIKKETRQVMENLKSILLEAKTNFEKVVKVSIFISDMNNFSSINDIYGEYFPNDNAPARETVQVAKLPKNVNVEISLIALVD